MDLGMPITLVVKAPNQKIEDQTIECALGWTIKDLKEHISNVYPSKPRKNHQKLIYSGRLLNDHLTLKDVLRQYEEQAVHTVHLVCAQSHVEQTQKLASMNSAKQEKADTSSSSASSVDASPSATPPVSPSQEGIRRRNLPTTSDSTTAVTTEALPIPNATTTPAPQPHAFQNMYAGNMMYGGGYYPGMMPGMVPGMMPFSPEQMMWFQQMYAQQMAQYMHLYHPGAVPPPPPTSPTLAGQPPQADPMGNQHAPAGNHQPNQPRDIPMRMNAQGGMVMDDDDDDMNRDWLDWTYTITRIAVLLSIVYFYSTFGRFLLVFSLFVAAYMYQAGWFGVQRRNPVAQNPDPVPAPQAEQQQAQQQQQQQPQQEQQPADVGDRHGEENVVEETSEDEDTTTDEASVTEPVEPPQPRRLAVAWSFFYTFFSSLIPEQPPAVNAN